LGPHHQCYDELQGTKFFERPRTEKKRLRWSRLEKKGETKESRMGLKSKKIGTKKVFARLKKEKFIQIHGGKEGKTLITVVFAKRASAVELLRTLERRKTNARRR